MRRFPAHLQVHEYLRNTLLAFYQIFLFKLVVVVFFFISYPPPNPREKGDKEVIVDSDFHHLEVTVCFCKHRTKDPGAYAYANFTINTTLIYAHLNWVSVSLQSGVFWNGRLRAIKKSLALTSQFITSDEMTESSLPDGAFKNLRDDAPRPASWVSEAGAEC